MTKDAALTAEALDEACASEPIHLPGAIQPHGVLLGLEPGSDLTVVVASANAPDLLGMDVLGRSLADIADPAAAAALRDRFEAGELAADLPWETTIAVDGGRAPLDAVVHAHDGLIILELEATADQGTADHGTTDPRAIARLLQRAIGRLRMSTGTVDDLAHVAVDAIRRISGYERVLIYRFDRDWHGMAIAEDQVAGWDQSFLGLRFPASDIPRQARELYARSTMRWVPRRDYAPVPLLAAAGWRHDRPVDLSFARLRSLSPVHLQYHRNMGVDGTMSVSVLRDGLLWGLVVCHHRAPHQPSPEARAAVAALTDAFALRLAPTERAQLDARRRADVHRMTALLAHMAASDDVAVAATTGPARIDSFFEATGAVAVAGDRIVPVGRTPPVAALKSLAAWLRERPDAEVFHTDRLSAECPAMAAFSATASGVMAVFLDADKADMLVWLRPEEAQTVSWGGDPRKEDGSAPQVPRQSFERWVETRHGLSRPWEEWDLETASDLRQSVMEVVVRNLRRVAELSDQLRQSQKMEAVGQLTGGLAHDFNNLLTGITGSLDLLSTRLVQGRFKDVDRYVAAAQGAAKRAASLTHRLLAFSRRQTLEPTATDVKRLIAGMEELIRRTVGPAITVEVVGTPAAWPALVDPNQLENALLNLCINARDAMPEGGRITIETANRLVDDHAARERDLRSGQYLTLSVSDTGTGMPPEVIARAFDPFFTTKPLGQGTGLGLSMIYGFAKQSGGQVRIYSEVGIGTTVAIYLPRHAGAAPLADATPTNAARAAATRGQTVLVVDDEPTIRMLVVETLDDAGYASIEAKDGTAAMKVLESDTIVDLLITDVGLPGGMNGRQLADAGRTLRPNLKVLFITGYAENAAVGDGVLDPGMRVMCKPFAMDALASRIDELLKLP